MLASLPWYDLPEIASATDAFWEALSRRLRAAGFSNVPGQLNRKLHHEAQWRSPRFLFGQACGTDLRIHHVGRLQLVATPTYAAPGCEASRYRSFLVVREDRPFDSLEDLRGSTCAVNALTSHSGMNALRALAAPLSRQGRFFGGVVLSGSHVASVSLVARGAAGVAAIDCVTWALLARHRPGAVAGLRILHQTRPAPAPPYVTGFGVPAAAIERLRQSLSAVVADPGLASVRESLLLERVDVLPQEAYDAIVAMADGARRQGYDEIERMCAADIPARRCTSREEAVGCVEPAWA